MAVYVDRAMIPFGRMKMCHMIADTIDELQLMAYKIGLQRIWVQNGTVTHYDICLSMRRLAIQYGAIEIDNQKLVELIRKKRGSGGRNDSERCL